MKVSNSNNKKSISAKARGQRINLFGQLLTECGVKNGKVLDIGGLVDFWRMNAQYLPSGLIKEIDIVNLPSQKLRHEQIGEIKLNIYGGNALDGKSLRHEHYTVIHSNSVIEHVGNLRSQKNMADVIKNKSDYYWVQTPAKSFPLEPHFYFPFFSYLPLWIQTKLYQNFSLGFMGKEPDWFKARTTCEQTRLLTLRELTLIFDSCGILKERLFMMDKSYVATNMISDGAQQNI
jgi:hypothetical protein